MSLGSVLRVRKDMEAHQAEDGQEDVYLLTPAAEQDGYSIERKFRRRRTFSSLLRPSLTLIIMFSIVCLALGTFFFASS